MTPSSPKKTGTSYLDVCRASQRIYGDLKKAERVVQPPVLIRGWLIPYIEEKLSAGGKFEIELVQKSWNSQYLYGLMLRYPDRAKISVSSNLNTCWRRYVATKELSHLLIDCPGNYTTDPVALVQGLIVNVPDSLKKGDLQSEQVTMCAAVELLLPWCFRGILEGMAKDGHSHLKIAQQFRVPQKLITAMLTGEYGKLSKETNLLAEGGVN